MPLAESPFMTVDRRRSVVVGGDPIRTVVWVHGAHDAATKAALSLILVDAKRIDGGDLVVDLSSVSFMDASTIGALVAARNRLRVASGVLTVRNPSPPARHQAGLAALIPSMAVAPTERPLHLPDVLIGEPGGQEPTLASPAGLPHARP